MQHRDQLLHRGDLAPGLTLGRRGESFNFQLWREIDSETAANAATSKHDFLVALERAQKAHGLVEPEPMAMPDPEPAPETGLRLAAS